MSERHSIQELNQLFLDGESADKDLYAEQRSNIQLIAGEHYAKKGNKFWNRLRDNKDISNEQKIRLTKNHIRRIALIYRNSITSYAPGVQADAKDKTSMQHQKTAELTNAVWQDGKNRHDFNQEINKWASDFVGIGEVAVKIYFDPNAGKFLGMEAQMGEDGQMELDEQGQPQASEIPRFAGDVLIERLYGFNIIRSQGAKSLKESPFLCHRKMVSTKDAKSLVDSAQGLSPEEKQKIKSKITDSADQTYIVLDGNTGHYKSVKNQTMLKEWFFRPCVQYPQGYFYICTNDDIIFDGELPFGIFPIVMEGFDEIQTSPRCRSVVKQLRPYQVEINRCASKMAEHQITLGDDKVLVQNGTKLVPGIALPGVRSFQYSGMAPIVMEGRSGSQYLEYMNGQISEMYSTAMVDEQLQEKEGSFDVYAMLARSLKDKKKFSIYTDTFESFLKQVFKVYVTTCQKYYGPQHYIPAVGKSEYINIDEFKKADELCYSINLEAQSDDSEKRLGRQLMLNHIIQFVGPQLAKDDLGKIIKLMPYANDELILEDLTLDYDVAVNYMLAMDRGQQPVPNQYDNHEYLIKKFTSRTRQPDYQMIDPYIKSLYAQAIAAHEQLKTQQEVKLKQAQSQFIPTGGYLVASDFYVPDPNNPQKLPKRVRLPSEAMAWLINQLDAQGSDQESLTGLSGGAKEEMSTMLLNQLGQQAPQQQMQAPPMPLNGQTSPGGIHGIK